MSVRWLGGIVSDADMVTPEVLTDTTVDHEAMLDAGSTISSPCSVAVPDTPMSATTDEDQASFKSPPKPEPPAQGTAKQQPREAKDKEPLLSPPEPKPGPPLPSWTEWERECLRFTRVSTLR